MVEYEYLILDIVVALEFISKSLKILTTILSVLYA